MRISLGSIVALLAIIGSILIGGINFGEVRGNQRGQEQRLEDVQGRIDKLERQVEELDSRTRVARLIVESMRMAANN